MSVADHEIEEPSEPRWHCDIHDRDYINYCFDCRDDEADRQYDERKERGR
jgi:hypothetical protein